MKNPNPLPKAVAPPVAAVTDAAAAAMGESILSERLAAGGGAEVVAVQDELALGTSGLFPAGTASDEGVPAGAEAEDASGAVSAQELEQQQINEAQAQVRGTEEAGCACPPRSTLSPRAAAGCRRGRCRRRCRRRCREG